MSLTSRRRLFLALTLTLAPRTARPQGSPLGPEFQVNTYTAGPQESPRVAADPSGNFVVVWQSQGQDGSYWGVFGQRYATSGLPLGTEFRVNTYTTYYQTFPSAAFDPAGNFIVVWASHGQDSSLYNVAGQRFASSGAPLGTEFRANTFTTNDQKFPAAAFDPSGNFIVVWQGTGQDGSMDGVFGQRYDSTGAPAGSEFRVNSNTTGTQRFPAVAFAPSGDFVVVWDGGSDGSAFGIFGQRFDSAGAPLGSEFRVNTYTTGYQTGPSVASSAGGFVVVWGSADGSADGAFGQRFDSAGAPLGSEFRVNTFTTSYQSTPRVASDSSGNFVVIWKSFLQDGSGSGVFGQRYDATGVPQGSEFRVNTETSSDQTQVAVASDSVGRFVVAWQSYDQDGSVYGIFGQRFAPMLPVELMGWRVE